jgi:hypothetical protein
MKNSVSVWIREVQQENCGIILVSLLSRDYEMNDAALDSFQT